MTNLNKSFFIKHTTGAAVYCKIQNTENNTWLNVPDGMFITTPSGTNGRLSLTESGKVSTLYTVNWNTGLGWRDGEYLIAFYDAGGLLLVQKFLVHKDRVNILQGFTAVPAG